MNVNEWRGRVVRGLAALVLLLPLACGGSDTGGNGVTTAEGDGVLGQWVYAGGLERTYSLFVPDNPDSHKLPLLIVFHGAGGTGPGMRTATGLDAVAARYGFAVAYPNGVGSWAVGLGTRADWAGVDDVHFVHILIAHLAARMPIDLDRVHVTGFSDGATMTYRLGCQLTSELASINAVCSGIPGFAQLYGSPSGKIAAQVIGGTRDQIFPYRDVAETAREWAEWNGCTSDETDNLPDSPNDALSVTRVTYGGCQPGRDVRFYLVEGMGHEWPGATWAQTSVDINASEVVLEFASRHSRTGTTAASN